jgi:alpha-ketoglutarate-dependent taurine dioxygenase
MTTVKEVLDEGPGVTLIDRLSIQEYSRPVATAVYWVLGSLLGRPVAQNWEGLMLYDVRNTGKTHGDGVRGSVTNVELFYHTDNSYGLMPPQYIGLLCLQTAKTGGESRLINWAEVLKRLQAEKPHLVDRGFHNFLFERQKEHAPGAPAVLSKPVFKSNGKDINVCYSSRLMRTGYRMAEQDLDDAGKEFLDVVDEIISRNDIQLKMYIEQGQIQFINNARIGHSRSEFADYDEPERMRHLVRLWFREHGNTNYDG